MTVTGKVTSSGTTGAEPIEGATRYEVMYPDLTGTKSFQTTTNVADEREWWTFKAAQATSVWSTIRWRVRAIRYIDDKDLLKNGLPRASYGPWSSTFTSVDMGSKRSVVSPSEISPVLRSVASFT